MPLLLHQHRHLVNVCLFNSLPEVQVLDIMATRILLTKTGKDPILFTVCPGERQVDLFGIWTLFFILMMFEERELLVK